MMLRLQRYDILVSYVSGKLLYLADTLSRAFKPSNQPSPQSDLETVCMIANVPMTENRISEIQSACATIDQELQLLKTVILKGWPTDKLGIPTEVLPYFPIRDELSVQDGLIFRGERVVIPVTLRAILKDKIHSSHLGIEGCLRRAREALYWPNMNCDLKDYISKCSICRTTSYSQKKIKSEIS